MEGPLPGATGAYGEWTRAVEAEGALRHVAKAGQRIELGDGAHIEVLAPDRRLDGGDLNNNSVVLRLVYGEVSFLLTGDLAGAGEKALLDSGFDLRSTVLKVAHHGSEGSTSEEFLDAVAPAVAAVSSGAGNPFGHPAPGLRRRSASAAVSHRPERQRAVRERRSQCVGGSRARDVQRRCAARRPCGSVGEDRAQP